MLDKIKMRKIRYDVVKQLEYEDLLKKINTALDCKEKYINDVDFFKELQKQANLDMSKISYVDIVEQLNNFVEDSNKVESIEHLPMLDYIDELFVEDSVDEYSLNTDKVEEFENFLLQLFQVEKLQVRMLEQAQQIFYIGNKNDIYDVATDKVVIKSKQPQIIWGWAMNNMVKFAEFMTKHYNATHKHNPAKNCMPCAKMTRVNLVARNTVSKGSLIG